MMTYLLLLPQQLPGLIHCILLHCRREENITQTHLLLLPQQLPGLIHSVLHHLQALGATNLCAV